MKYVDEYRSAPLMVGQENLFSCELVSSQKYGER